MGTTNKPLLILAILLVLFSSTGLAVLLAQEEKGDPAAPPPGPATEPAAAPGAAVPAASLVPADTPASGGEAGPGPAAPNPAAAPTPDTAVPTDAGIYYGISPRSGFLVSLDRGGPWMERNQGLPVRHVYPFQADRVRYLTSLGVDPVHANRVAVTTVDEIYVSEDFGLSWKRLPTGRPLRETSYMTSIALSPASPDAFLVGTSFNGFFETTDRGKSWQDPSLTASFLYRGAGFYEEIAGITYHPEDPRTILFSCGFGKGIYRASGDRKTWTPLAFIGDRPGEIVQSLRFIRTAAAPAPAAPAPVTPAPAGDPWVLEAQTRTAVWRYAAEGNRWMLERSLPPRLPESVLDSARGARLAAAGNRFGIYLSSFHVSDAELDGYIAFLKEHGMNSLVVDFKEDLGLVTYDTRLELPRKMGAVSRRINLELLLEKAHANGIYIIGRVLVFKDRALYNHDGYRYAAWDRVSGAPWRYLVPTQDEQTGETVPVQREYWVDPFATFVWEYNVSIAKELQDRGVDEIQFDYIRFPSDGPLSRIRYRFQPEGMHRIDALESFLTLARESIHIPISTDLYGFNSWHRMGNWIGQCIEVLADYVDAICPMFYPSHFPIDFIGDQEYLDRARTIYQEGVTRSASIVEGRSLIRPYVQAFLIGDELRMEPARYSTYLIRQLEGTLAAPSCGYTLWNAANRYYMVRGSLRPYTQSGCLPEDR
jgi:hypothetical protein